MIWDIVSITSMVIASFLTVLFIFLSIKYYKQFIKLDEALKYVENKVALKKYVAGNINEAFINKNESKDWFDKYIISHEGKHTFLLCHSIESWQKDFVLEIRIYHKKKDYIESTYMSFEQGYDFSQPIEVDKRTHYVNLYVHETVDEPVDLAQVKLKKKAYRLLSMLSSSIIFFIMIPFGIHALKMMSKDEFEAFMILDTILLGLGLMAGLSIVNYFVYIGWAHLREKKVMTHE